MAYTDTVLAKNPIQYCTLTGTAYNTSYSQDLTGNGYHIPGYTAGKTFPINPGDFVGSVLTTAVIPNPLGCLNVSGQKRNYTIEFWGRIKNSQFTVDNSSAQIILQNQDASCKIYAENSFMNFYIKSSTGEEYIAKTNFNHWGDAFHVVAIYSPQGFSITVNGETGDSVIFPKSSLIATTSPENTNLYLSNSNVIVSSFATYNKKMTTDQINSNYQAGKSYFDSETSAKYMGANCYDLTKDAAEVPFKKIISDKDFLTGNLRNLILEDSSLKCLQYPNISVQNSSQVEQTPSFTSSKLNLTANSLHATIDAIPVVNNSTGFIGIKSTIPTLTSTQKQILLTIYSKNYDCSWSWYVDSSYILYLKKTVYDTGYFTISNISALSTNYRKASTSTAHGFVAGSIVNISGSSVDALNETVTVISTPSGQTAPTSTEFYYSTTAIGTYSSLDEVLVEGLSTPKTYQYTTTTSAGGPREFWVIFDAYGVRVSNWALTGFNQVSSSDIVAEQIVIDSTTEILFNTDETYSSSYGTDLYFAYFGKDVPETISSNFSTLKLPENNTCWYDFTQATPSLSPSTQGEWVITTDLGYQGPYYGSYVDFDLSEDLLSKMYIRYRDGNYLQVSQKSFIPTASDTSATIPFSGSFGTYFITNITDPSPGGATGTAKNLLTANQASTETDASGWNPFDNSSVARIASPVPPTTYSGVSGARFTGSGLSLTGTVGNYASSPNAAPLQITGDIDLRCKVSLDDWTPSTDNNLIAKEVNTILRAYRFYVLPSGALAILVSFNGTDFFVANSSIATGITDGSTKWVRATRAAATGLVTFFLSDDGTTWTQLGATVSGTAGNIFNSSSPLDIGSRHTGTSLLTKGTIYRAQILNGIDGTLAFDANFENVSEYSAKMIESSANAAVVTLNTTFKSTEFSSGSWSLELTRGATPADDGRALSNPRPAVIPGQTYTASALIDGHTNGGSIGLYFYNSIGNGVGQVNSTGVPAGVKERRTISMVAPAGSASAGLIITTASTAGATRYDNMGIWAGTPQQIVSRTATTSEPHGFSVGNTVTISGSPTLSETVVITEADSTTFTYTSAESGYYDPTDAVISDGESGPISIKAVLKTNNVIKNRPELNYINLYVYGEADIDGKTGIGPASLSGTSVIIKPEMEPIWQSGKKLNCTFSKSSGYIKIPSVSTGDHQTIEFTFAIDGTISNNSVLISNDAATDNTLYFLSNNIKRAGTNWGDAATKVYINGVELSPSGSAVINTDSPNHVLIISNATTTNEIYLNTSVSNFTTYPYGQDNVSGTGKTVSFGYINTWSYALSTSQADAIINLLDGICSKTLPCGESGSASSNVIPVVEVSGTNPNIYVKPWAANSVI